MPTLKRYWVKNFQSLRHVDLPLGRLTAITGDDSDLGKSACIRAVLAAITGDNGKGMARAGSPGWSMGLVYDGYTVTWDGKEYGLQIGDGPAEKLESKDLVARIGMEAVTLSKDTEFYPNLVPPLAPAPLVLDPPADAARKLAPLRGGAPESLAAMREANRQSKSMAKDRASIQRQREIVKVRLDVLWRAPEELKKAQELQQKLEKVRVLAKSFRSAQRAYAGLHDADKKLAALQAEVDAMAKIKPGLDRIDDIVRLTDQLILVERVRDGIAYRTEVEQTLTADLKKRIEVAKEADKRLRESLKAGTPCPFSRHPLPQECVDELTTNTWQE